MADQTGSSQNVQACIDRVTSVLDDLAEMVEQHRQRAGGEDGPSASSALEARDRSRSRSPHQPAEPPPIRLSQVPLTLSEPVDDRRDDPDSSSASSDESHIGSGIDCGCHCLYLSQD